MRAKQNGARERKSVGGGGVWEREVGMKVREERRRTPPMIETSGGSDSSPTVRLRGGMSDSDPRGSLCVCQEWRRVRNVHSVAWLALSKDTHVQTLLHTHGCRQRHQKELRPNRHTRVALSLSQSVSSWNAQEASAVIQFQIFSISSHLFCVFSNFIYLFLARASNTCFSFLLSQFLNYFIGVIVLHDTNSKTAKKENQSAKNYFPDVYWCVGSIK